MNHDDLQAVLDQLQDDDPEERLKAVAELLDRREPRGVAALLAALDDPDYRVRAWAASALGWIGDQTAAVALVPLLTESPQAEWDTRINPPMCACFALALLQQVEPVLSLLDHDDEHVRSLAVITLRYIGDAATVPHLEALSTDDPSDIVRDEAADALSAMQSPDFLPLWRQFLE